VQGNGSKSVAEKLKVLEQDADLRQEQDLLMPTLRAATRGLHDAQRYIRLVKTGLPLEGPTCPSSSPLPLATPADAFSGDPKELTG